MSQWHCAINGQSVGPVDDAGLRAMAHGGRLGPADLVWRDGMADWVPAHTVPGLFPPAAPPVARGPLSAGPVALPAGAAPLLAYATPTHLAPVQHAGGPVIRPDDGPFLKVGGSFNTGKARWTGPVAASPHAFYLLKVARQQNYHGGGLIGVIVSAAMAKEDDVRTCTLADLPPAVQQFLNPKGKEKLRAKDVIVLPRDTIRRVKVPGFNNAVTAFVGNDKVTMFVMLFRNGTIRRFLTENGWTVNADVQPTAAPVHGEGFGRAWGEAPKHGMGVGARVGLIVLAVVLLLIIILASVASH